jgi:predicted nucleic acid-binding protein
MTKARHREKMDIKNMVSVAIMNEAYAKKQASSNDRDFDATQLIISGKRN